MKNHRILPEGYGPLPLSPLPLSVVQELIETEEVAEALAVRCDTGHNLHVRFRGYEGIIPRAEAVSPLVSGADREIAVLSRVGHCVQFIITSIAITGGGKPVLILSRRKAQERALQFLLESCPPGTVLRGKITHLERFGAFVDIGGGVVGLLPLEHISVARITHPAQRFVPGQNILCAVSAVNPAAKRFTLTHKELLGTWAENVRRFHPGMTVPGIVRGLKDYGAFVELSPNLSGLAERSPLLREGGRVSVYIKAILPQSMKIKLLVIDELPPASQRPPLEYFITGGRVDKWKYAPPGCSKVGPESVFCG